MKERWMRDDCVEHGGDCSGTDSEHQWRERAEAYKGDSIDLMEECIKLMNKVSDLEAELAEKSSVVQFMVKP